MKRVYITDQLPSELENKIKKIEKELKKYPPDRLSITRTGDYWRWYRISGKERTYISKKNRPLAEKLALKFLLEQKLLELRTELRAVRAYLQIISTYPSNPHHMEMLESEELQKLIPYSRTLSDKLNRWQTQEYDKNESYPENLIHHTIKGDFVRSKAEGMIADTLYRMGIPYRYECRLDLADGTCYPDFTIIHPVTGETWYLEHYGKMDDEEYIEKYHSKNRKYIENGYLEGHNLICTFESKSKPLDNIQVEQVLQFYFGDCM